MNTSQFSIKRHWITIIQVILSIAILVFAALGLTDSFPLVITNIIDLILITILLIICGVRFLPDRTVYAIIYFVSAGVSFSILVASFFI